MKKKFSRKWKSSKQPRKQRKYRHNAPLHTRQKMAAAHLDKLLRKEYGKRSMPLRSGDEVIIMRGKFRKMRGNVSKIDLTRMKIFVDKIKTKKISGQEVDMPIDPSNVKITKLNLDDKERIKALRRVKKKEKAAVEEKKKSTVSKEKPEAKEAEKKEQPVPTILEVKKEEKVKA